MSKSNAMTKNKGGDYEKKTNLSSKASVISQADSKSVSHLKMNLQK